MKKEIKLETSLDDFVKNITLTQSEKFVAFLHGERMTTLDDMYKAFVTTLQFPDYFGWNWNAMEDCLTDFWWLDKTHYVIVISQYEKILTEYEYSDFDVNEELFNLGDVLKCAVEIMKGKLEVYIQENDSFYQILSDK